MCPLTPFYTPLLIKTYDTYDTYKKRAVALTP